MEGGHMLDCSDGTEPSCRRRRFAPQRLSKEDAAAAVRAAPSKEEPVLIDPWTLVLSDAELEALYTGQRFAASYAPFAALCASVIVLLMMMMIVYPDFRAALAISIVCYAFCLTGRWSLHRLKDQQRARQLFGRVLVWLSLIGWVLAVIALRSRSPQPSPWGVAGAISLLWGIVPLYQRWSAICDGHRFSWLALNMIGAAALPTYSELGRPAEPCCMCAAMLLGELAGFTMETGRRRTFLESYLQQQKQQRMECVQQQQLRHAEEKLLETTASFKKALAAEKAEAEETKRALEAEKAAVEAEKAEVAESITASFKRALQEETASLQRALEAERAERAAAEAEREEAEATAAAAADQLANSHRDAERRRLSDASVINLLSLGSQVFHRDWKEVRVLGAGQFGRAVLYLNAAAGDHAVCKFIWAGHARLAVEAEDPAAEQQAHLRHLEREATVLATVLPHPHIIRYRTCFHEGEFLCIVTDYAAGGTLRHVIARKRKAEEAAAASGQAAATVAPFPASVVISWAAQLVAAVDWIHSQGVLHRDIKPGNIFLSASMHVQLGDFGLSRTTDPPCAEALLACTACGTPYYMSPEVMRGERYSYPSDVWALACTVFEILTLKRAFRAPSLPQLARLIAGDEGVSDANTRQAELLDVCATRAADPIPPALLALLAPNAMLHREPSGRTTLHDAADVLHPLLPGDEVARMAQLPRLPDSAVLRAYGVPTA
jgi:NIMA (never in mitosis gene a)-related kinase